MILSPTTNYRNEWVRLGATTIVRLYLSDTGEHMRLLALASTSNRKRTDAYLLPWKTGNSSIAITIAPATDLFIAYEFLPNSCSSWEVVNKATAALNDETVWKYDEQFLP